MVKYKHILYVCFKLITLRTVNKEVRRGLVEKNILSSSINLWSEVTLFFLITL